MEVAQAGRSRRRTLTAIWLLSSRGRPRDAQDTIDACMDAGMTSPGVIYCDETPYPKLRLPKNWRYHHEPTWGSLQASMQWCYDAYPYASAYGWLADDTRPRTPGWDRLLEGEAGEWNLAYARDLWFSEDPFEEGKLEAGINLSSGLCWGGQLVRTVGWWALPGVRQGGIDMAWLDIARPLGLHRYCRWVTVEHLNWRTGKRPFDDGDEWSRGGVDYIEQDFAAKTRWMGSGEYRDILFRVSRAVHGLVTPSAMQAVRQSYADALFTSVRGLPAARLQRILGGELDATILDSHTDEGQA